MITTPEEDILQASPAFQNKIIKMRQQIADKEMEIQRLNKEIISLTYTNEQLILQKKELEPKIVSLASKADGLESTIGILTTESDSLKKEVKKSEDKLKGHQIKMEEQSKIVYEAQCNLKAEKQIHDSNVIQLSVKQQEVKTKEESLNKKLDKLREIIQ
jgi:predicted  nucleic acid-binding Zn-ribbon protein